MDVKGQAQEYYRRSGQLYQMGRLPEAIAALRQSLEWDPNNSAAHNDLGRMYQEMDDLAQAADEFHAAIAVDPDNHEAHNNLGIVYYAQGRKGEAVREFETTRRLQPDYPDVYNNLGAVYEDMGQLDDAIMMYQKAVSLRQDYLMAENNLYRAMQKKGRPQSGKTDHKQPLGRQSGRGCRGPALILFLLVAVPLVVFLARSDLRLGWLSLGLLGASVLVFSLNTDLRSPSANYLEFYRFNPGAARLSAVFIEAVKVLIASFILAYLEVWICLWTLMHIGRTDLADLLGWGNGSHTYPFDRGVYPFWWVVVGFALAILIARGLRGRQVAFHPYDLFLSYKSQNAETARQIAERLTAAGLKVWFAEYELLVRDQLLLQQMPTAERTERINAAIDAGVSQSSYGLALTNNPYAESPYCSHEIDALMKKGGPEHVLEVMIPQEDRPHEVCLDLALSPSMIYQGSTDEVLEFILQNTGWAMPLSGLSREAAPARTYYGEYLGQRYALDSSGWEVSKESEKIPNPVTQDLKGPSFQRNVAGGALSINLILGTDFGVDNYRTALAREETNTEDDRKLYDHLMQNGSLLMKQLKSRARGVHLVHQGGHSQFAITYQMLGAWTRTYSIILGVPGSDRLAEFVFTCGTTKLSFRGFCEDAYLYDQFIASLRWC